MNSLIDTIRESVIGENQIIETPFGQQPLVYADYTASGRSLGFIEDYIRQEVLPFYANTHTETSYTGAQTSILREEARQEIRSAINARKEDKVIFCGSGATAAIHKLIDMLNIRLPSDLNDRYKLQQQIPENERPVVFIGPYEHHSNELPWRESIAELVVIPLDNDGLLDLAALDSQLQIYNDRPMKIGSFSAASNVTGLKTDVEAVAQLLHRYDALSFWDYAAAAPYVGIDMRDNKNTAGNSSKDAVFISPHKFIGGPGTPGILVVNQQVINNRVPAVPGGGTVLYVTPDDHRYIANTERREEGGTPAIVESIRAGLVFKLQQSVGIEEIERREARFVQRALTRWSDCDNIEILGNTSAPRLSIISLRVKYNDKDLHYGFVVALLNDLFGIQARGGCSCAGPYGHSLLGMDMAYSKAIEEQLTEDKMIMRPGWVRLNFNYFIDEETFEYIVHAVELVAKYGWKLLPFYNFDQTSGVWRYQDIKSVPSSSLSALNFNHIGNNITQAASLPSNVSLQDYMALAEENIRRDNRDGLQYYLKLPEATEKLRWFTLPQETRVLDRKKDFKSE